MGSQPLTPEEQKVLDRLWLQRRYIAVSGRRLIVYAESLNGEDASVVSSLLFKGYVAREKIGRRKVLILGEWTPLEKSLKKEPSPEESLEAYLQMYTPGQRAVIRQAFEAFAECRATRKVSPNILINELRYYMRFPPEVVVEALATYVSGEYWKRGMGEAYARGIIRGKYKKGVEEGRVDDNVVDHRRKSIWSQKEEIARKRSQKETQLQIVVREKVEKYLRDLSLDWSDVNPTLLRQLEQRARREIKSEGRV